MKDEYKEMVCRVRFIDGVPAQTYLSDVEIVRCKDCKHRIKEDNFCMAWARYGIKDNGFCDRAQRKGDDYETNR